MQNQQQTAKVLNEEVSQAIISLINNFGFKAQAPSIHFLSNGEHLSRLAACVLKMELNDQFEKLDVHNRFEFIEKFIQDRCRIKEGVSYDDAKEGNTFELAKIAFIILINGIVAQKDEFINACDKLSIHQSDLIQRFYEVLDVNRVKIPLHVKLYEDFLSIPKHELTPRSKRTLNKIAENTPNQANYLLSPFAKTSLNTPKSTNKKKINEDDFIYEKRRLEVELRNRDMEVEELGYQIQEKEAQIKQMESKMEEYARKAAELISYREKAYEYDQMIEKHHVYENENAGYIERIKKLLGQIDELNKIKQSYEAQQKNLSKLNEQLEGYEKKERSLQAEVKRLKNLEDKLAYSNERIKAKEDDILKLLNEKVNLENDIKSLNYNFNEKKMQYEEKLDEYSGENAVYQSQVSLLNANIANLTAEYEESANRLKSELAEKNQELEDEKNKLAELNSELKRKEDEICDLNQEILTLKQDLDRIDELNKQKEFEINGLKSEINKKLQEIENLESCIQSEKLYSFEEKDRHEKRYNKLHNEYEAKYNYCSEIEGNLRRINEINKRYEAELNTLKIENTNCCAKIANLESLKEQLQNQLNKLKDANCTQEDEIIRLKREMSAEINEKTKLKSEYLNEKAYFESRIVDLDNEIKQLNLNKLALKEEIEALECNLQQQYGKLDEEMKTNAQLTAQGDELMLKNDTLRHEMNKLNVELNSKCHQLEECLEAKKELEFKIGDLEASVERQCVQIEEEMRMNAELRVQIVDLLAKYEALKNEITELNGQLSSKCQELEQCLAEKRNLEVKMTELSENHVKQSESMMAEHHTEREKWSAELEGKSNESRELTHQIASISEKLNEQLQVFAHQKTAIETLEEEKQVDQSKICDFEKLSEMNRHEIVALREEVKAQEQSKTEMQNAHEEVVHQYEEKLERAHKENEHLQSCLNVEKLSLQEEKERFSQLYGEYEAKLKYCSEIEEGLQASNQLNERYETELNAVRVENSNRAELISKLETMEEQLQCELSKLQEHSGVQAEEINKLKLDLDGQIGEKTQLQNEYTNEKANLDAHIMKLSDEISQLCANKEALMNAVEALDGNLQQEYAKVAEEVQTSENLRAQISQLEKQSHLLSQEINELGSQLNVESLNLDECLRLKQGLEEKTRELEENLQQQCAKLDEEMKINSQLTLHGGELRSENDALQQQLEDLNLKLNTKTLQLEECLQLKQSLEEKISELESHSQQQSVKIAEEVQTNSQLATQIDELSSVVSKKQEEIEQLQSCLDTEQSSLQQERDRYSQLIKDFEVKHKYCCEIEDNLVALTETFKQCEADLSDAKANVASLESMKAKLQHELAQHQDESTAQMNKLKEDLSAQLNENSQLKKDYFNEKSQYESRFIHLENVIQELSLSKQTMSDELEASLQQQYARLDAEIKRNDALTVEVNNVKLENGSLKQEMNKMNTELHLKGQQLQQCSEEKQSHEVRISELSRCLEASQKQMEDLRVESVNLQKVLANEKHQNEVNRSSLMKEFETHFEQERLTKNFKISELEVQLNERNKQLECLSIKLDEYSKNLEHQEQRCQFLLKRNETLIAEFNAEKLSWSAALETKVSELNELIAQVATMNGKLAEQFKLQESLQKTIETLEKEKEQVNENQINEYKKQIEVLKKEAKTYEDSKLETKKTHDLTVKQLNSKLEGTQKENEQLKRGYQELKEHLQKFEEHYNKKKQIFQNSEVSLTEATKKLDQYEDRIQQYEANINELNEKYSQLKQEYEQLNQHHKVITNENRTLKTSVDYLERQLRDGKNQHIQQSTPAVHGAKLTMPSTIKRESGYGRESMFKSGSENKENKGGFLSLGRTAGAKVAGALHLKTPKSKQFLDDSEVKYSSPNHFSNENEFFPIANPDELSFRRQSIDTIASARLGNSTMASGHQINRFDAISENDFEAAFSLEKNLPFDNHSSNGTVNNERLSILQTRNLKQKPHLKSAYPLETLSMPEVNENQIREGSRQQREILKSKVNLKRPLEVDADSPIKKQLDAQKADITKPGTAQKHGH